MNNLKQRKGGQVCRRHSYTSNIFSLETLKRCTISKMSPPLQRFLTILLHVLLTQSRRYGVFRL